VTIRGANIDDLKGILKLYKEVARIKIGIARNEEEVSLSYVEDFVRASLKEGIIIVAEEDGEIIGEIHSHKMGLKIFDHVLSNLTIVVSKEVQGKGVGRKLFNKLLKRAREMKEIKRVELLTRVSNEKAIKFYESLGFEIEGRLKKRISNFDGTFEEDIMMGLLI